MNVNGGAVWALILMVALLYSAAETNEPHDCDESTLKMTINTAREIFNIYYKSYGEDITLHCFIDDPTNLTIEIDCKTLQIEQLDNSVRFTEKKPNVGGYFYICKDNKTGCADSLAVEVRPAMSVQSPGVRQRRINGVLNFFVPVGETYDVLCSSNRGDGEDNIHIYEDAGRLEEEDVNGTTIKHRALAGRVEDKEFICNRNVAELDRVVYEVIYVIVDFFPECLNFRCFLSRINTVNDFDVLECSWTYASDKNTYTLSYVDSTDYDDSTVLCSDNSGERINTCTANEKLMSRRMFPYGEKVSLELKTCNTIFCNRQSFAMNADVIRKHKPLYKELDVLNITSYSVVLGWFKSTETGAFKVEYHHEHWQQANTSSVSCHKYKCQFELFLPYPDTEYDVRVSMRHKDATHEGSWSEPMTTAVHTTTRSKCNCNPLQLGPENACQACRLIEDVIKENLSLKKMKTAWKLKIAKIEALKQLKSLAP